MTKYQFALAMKPLVETFKSSYPQTRLDMLFELVSFGEVDSFDLFVRDAVLHAKTAPLGKEFQSYVVQEKRRTWKPSEQPIKFDCDFCLDLGIIHVHSKYDNTKTLMLHDCIKEKPDHMSHMWQLPMWIKDCVQEFTPFQCPIEWFKPAGGKDISESIVIKAENWKKKIRAAEAHWIEVFKNARGANA